MGPRPLGRGWDDRIAAPNRQTARFNGAATARSRMVTQTAIARRGRSLASMGPRPLGRGWKGMGGPRRRGRGALQWGRDR